MTFTLFKVQLSSFYNMSKRKHIDMTDTNSAEDT